MRSEGGRRGHLVSSPRPDPWPARVLIRRRVACSLCRCWGNNDGGVLGDGSSYTIRTRPVSVSTSSWPSGFRVRSVACGSGNYFYASEASCAVVDTSVPGTVW